MKDMIIGFVILLIGLPAFPILAMLKSRVNNSAFERRVRIKHLWFLFCAPGDVSIPEEGLALPIFICQLSGYLLGLILPILYVICYLLSPTAFRIAAIISFWVLITEIICVVILELILLRISHPKQHFMRKR